MPRSDDSAPARVTVPAPAQLPPDVGGFVGRDAELALLDSAPSGVVVISGPPGVGKPNPEN